MLNLDFEKNYTRFILSVFLLFLLFVFFEFLANLSFPNAILSSPKTGTTNLYPYTPVTQVFSATKNNLSQINIGVKNIPKNIRHKILIQLADESCNNIIAEKEFSVFSVFSSPRKFKFPSIADSDGKRYCLKITYLGEKLGKGELPYVEISEKPADPNSSYTNPGKGGEFKGRTLKIEPAYSGTLSENLTQLNQRMSQYKPWFLKGNYLVAIFALFLINSIILVLILVLL